MRNALGGCTDLPRGVRCLEEARETLAELLLLSRWASRSRRMYSSAAPLAHCGPLPYCGSCSCSGICWLPLSSTHDSENHTIAYKIQIFNIPLNFFLCSVKKNKKIKKK